MIDFFFFLKTLILTLIVVLCLQIEIGNKTIETHMHDMIEHSIASGFVDNAAHGGAHVVKDFTHRLSEKMKENIGLKHKHNAPETKASSFNWGWSSKKPASDTAAEGPREDMD